MLCKEEIIIISSQFQLASNWDNHCNYILYVTHVKGAKQK